MNNFLVYSFMLLAFGVFRFESSAHGAVICQPIYGGGESCIVSPNIEVNKQILNPKTNKMVENLSINDPKYHPEWIVNFKITVANISESIIEKIDIKDIFPQYITFSTGPGNFDKATKTLSFSIESLEPNEMREFVIVGRVVPTEDLPEEVVCVVNRAIVSSGEDQATDNTQLCIENKVVEAPKDEKGFPVFPAPAITETPPTGPSVWYLIGLGTIGMVGLFLRKQFNNKISDGRR